MRYKKHLMLLLWTTACTPSAPSLETRLTGPDGTYWDIVTETGPRQEEPKLIEGIYLLPTRQFYHYNYFGGYAERTLFNVEPATAASRTSPQKWGLHDSLLTLQSTIQYQVHFRSPDTLRLAAVDTAHRNSLVLVRSQRGE